MEEIMQSNTLFIVPLTMAYASICGLWFLLDRTGVLWRVVSIEKTNNPWLDLGISLLAVIGIFGIGQLYSSGLLIGTTQNETLNLIIWPLNNILIFSPIFIVLILRKQSLTTLFISKDNWLKKVTFGFLASVIGILIFLSLRGELGRGVEIMNNSVDPKTVSNFPAIFFENAALAFLFVRLRWAVGIKWAIVVPAVVFALAHVPGSIAEGDPWSHIITFFFLTGGLSTFILYTAYRSRDILWLGVVHYLMDVAIKAV